MSTRKKRGAPPIVARPARIEPEQAAWPEPAQPEAAEPVEEEAGHQDLPAQPEAAEPVEEEAGHQDLPAQPEAAEQDVEEPPQKEAPAPRVIAPTPEERGPVADAWAVAKALSLRPDALAVRLEGVGCPRDARGIFEVDDHALQQLGFDRGTARHAIVQARKWLVPADAHGARVAAISPDPRLVGVRVEEGCATDYALTREPIRQTGIEVVVVPTPAGWEVWHG